MNRMNNNLNQNNNNNMNMNQLNNVNMNGTNNNINEMNNNMNMNQMNNMNMNQMNNMNMNQMNNMNMIQMNNIIMNQMNNLNYMNNNAQIIQNNNNSNQINGNQINNNVNFNINQMKKFNIKEEDIKKYFTNVEDIFFPVIGLNNVGLTCYMNSTLQCLLHIPELNNFFINIYPFYKEDLKIINKEAETKGCLSKCYYDLVEQVKNKNNEATGKQKYFFYKKHYSVSPEKFNVILSNLNPQFGRYESNDSKDLLLYLFQTMHEELNFFGDKKLKKVPKCDQRKEEESYNFFKEENVNLNLSIFSYLFYGVLKSCTICKQCNSVLYNFQYFQFLSFPIYNFDKKNFNLYMGLKEFIQVEEMTGDNKCYCQNCKDLKDSLVSSIIYETPPYLIINFDYGKDKKYKPKSIDFGQIIDLTNFTDPNCLERTYELIAVSTHLGKSGNSGHYIAYCKDQHGLWHLFNDSSHSDCNFEEVKKNSPYLLIFKRIKNQNYNK